MTNSNGRKLYTALITPYDQYGKIDYRSVDRLLLRQSGYADGIVIMGTTQESTLLTAIEKKRLVEYILQHCDQSLTKIVGIGEADTAKTVRNAVRAAKQGAEALLVVAPYYSKCTKQGLVEHYQRVCEATTLPIIVYNVPQRTGYDLSAEQLKELAQLPHIVAIKQCSHNHAATKKVIHDVPYCDMLSGNDSEWRKKRCLFAGGIVSVLSNALPQLARKAVDGTPTAMKTFEILAKLCAKEVSPVAVKYLCYKMGITDTCNMRLPLTPPSPMLQGQLDQFVQNYGEQLK